MSKKLIEESWRNLLPDVYVWIDKVNVDWPKAVQANHTYIIPVRTDSDQNDKRLVLSDALPTDTLSDVTKSWEKSGWLAKGGSLLVAAQNAQFLLVPLTQIKSTEAQISRQFGMDAAKVSKDYKLSSLVFCKAKGLNDRDVFDGLCMGLYDPGLFKGARMAGQKAAKLESMPELVGFLGWSDDGTFAHAKDLARATALVRMLQDAPANWLTPTRFGDIAADMAKDLGLTCSLLGPKELKALGAGSMLSVAAGSTEEPRLIAIEVKGKNPHKTIGLIGKGLTFDSGGISLKPGLGMGEMKYDMSGGAAVLGAAVYLAKAKPACNVVCVIGAVENMPGLAATRPGDIVVAMNGKSIDIQNTDAEGRLVLADLLHYTNITYKPELMVDVATLTGACLHALGHVGAGLMTNDQGTADQVLAAARSVGEPFWQLPLWPEFEKEAKGEWSDLANIAKPNVQAGTIMGGIFLSEFVGQTKWAHMDIAGTAWQCKATGFPQSGGSSFALRTLSEICLRG